MLGDTDQRQANDVEAGVRRFQERVLADYARLSPAGAQDIVERRRVAEQVRGPWREGGPEMARSMDLTIGPLNVPIRIHSPSQDTDLPALVYLHGGGWMLFGIDTHDRLMREYAHRAQVTVIGVEYSLAPEARFPVPIEEAVSVVRWLRSPEAKAHINSSCIAIGGDSAGANLAVATNLALRDAGDEVLDAALLNYGAFDRQVRPSHARYGGPDYMLTPEEMADFWDAYLGGENEQNPLARPFLADLSGLPPTFLCIAECDILVDENWEMARRLREAGVQVTAASYPGATHSFLEAVSVSPLADKALADASYWLSKTLRRSSGAP